MKKLIFILTFCSLVILPSCSVFESSLLSSEKTKNVHQLDTALSFTKSVIQNTDIEKKTFTRDDSLIFFEDFSENESYQLPLLIDSAGKTLSGIYLKKIGLEYDSIQIVNNKKVFTTAFYSNKKSLLYDIEKKYYIVFEDNKIISKTIKIEQKLLHEDSNELEITYSYNY